MKCLNEENVDVHFTGVVKITEDGLVGTDGSVVKDLDTIVFATGFDTTYIPHFKVVGKGGVTLSEKLTPNPDSYFGCGIPGKSSNVCWFESGKLTPLLFLDIPNYLSKKDPIVVHHVHADDQQ